MSPHSIPDKFLLMLLKDEAFFRAQAKKYDFDEEEYILAF